MPALRTSARRATPCGAASADYLRISIHALREEGDFASLTLSEFGRLFLSTPSARRATCPPALPQHHLPEFLSTPSARRATHVRDGTVVVIPFLSTPSARRATGCCNLFQLVILISIHALREEGDNGSSSRWPLSL